MSRGIKKRTKTYNMRIDKDEHLKIQELKKEYNMSVFFREALNKLYDKHIVKEKS